ncbi:Ldh family oxidoreductase [Burkholderia plantarii]|uniref:Malate/L-sulfolactate dehydrogenase n=1 Tax=Burkholderia plantarii TaxID=41899 RepID=A0A0B6RVU7_BURPL|nr:Ldh family oxidoreductase [Burkholderia plantarii]AJK49457.1 malate/L-sulfolactate dehydrogenase [Burkholderia plantarii]WLE62712.1 Ldh family oxidoreductase [Burkholderia plantarii]
MSDDTPDTFRRLAPDALREFVAAVYRSKGATPDDAFVAADAMVQADLWGHQSHGVLRLGWYYARLCSGAMRAQASPGFPVDAGAIAVMDGADGIGPAVARHAALDAIRRAKAHGIGAVSVRNSNHFGTCMYFTRMAAEQDCIMLCTTNGGPNMAPWGGLKKLIGTNPWSVAVPAGRYAPLVMDVANSGVARGKIFLAQTRHEPIPTGWAVDAKGRPTTDPKEALEGFILPMAGHKGYAIGTIVDVLSGVLSGSGFLDEVHGPYDPVNRSRAGHLMIALNVAAFQPLEAFHARMERYIETLKAVPLAEGVEEVFYPGEKEARAHEKQAAEGILLPLETVAGLDRVAADAGVAPVARD